MDLKSAREEQRVIRLSICMKCIAGWKRRSHCLPFYFHNFDIIMEGENKT